MPGVVIDPVSLARLLARARTAVPEVDGAALAAAVRAGAERRFADEAEPSAADVARYVEALHAEDLAFALACRAGSDAAWSTMIERHRPGLYAAARATSGDESAAREIADSLWAELYGMDERDGRRSLLAYFHGRSSLATWLRAIVAQRRVDRWRAERRLEALDEAHLEGAAGEAAAGDPDRRRSLGELRAALGAALARLSARDRLRLAAYHLRRRTLAEVGRMLAEHESTVSRKLDRTRRAVRRDVERELRRRGLDRDQIARCIEHGTEEWPFALDGLTEEEGR